MADVEDIGSRRIVGFAMAEHMRTELVAGTPDMAIAARGREVAGMSRCHFASSAEARRAIIA